MKLYRCVMVLILFFTMISCQRPEQDTKNETENTEYTETQETVPPETGTQITVVNIIDTTPEDMDSTMEEKAFYEDDQLRYFFYDAVSEHVIVEYSDGSTQNVKEALAEKSIRLKDLQENGIRYFVEPEPVKDIIYHADRGGEAEALEPFYEEYGYVYSFPSIRSDVVIVYYKDGTEKPIKEALADNTVQISDLDRFGIQYYKEEKEPLPPCGYGSGVEVFDSIREMIRQIESGTLSWTAQEIYDAHGCDTSALRELTGMDDGFSEFLVEWCGGMNYSINYQKDDQVIAFMPCDTMEEMYQAVSAMDAWESLQENDLLMNLVKTDVETDDGIQYECTYDTSVVSGLRITYHETTDASGIRCVVTNQYGADGVHQSGAVYVFDESASFYCLVRGFEADMDFAKRLETKLILKESVYYEN